MSPGIDTILFDLDGTLVDTLPGIEFSSMRALEMCGAPMVRQDFRSLVGPPIRRILGIITGWETVEQLDRLERAFREVYDGGEWMRASLYPGVRETLEVLHSAGKRLFVVTNKPHFPARRILEHLGMWPFFVGLFTPDAREPAFKTKAEALCRLRQEHLLSVSGMLFVGDSLDDAHAAAECGCQFAAVAFGYGTACVQRDFPIHFTLARFPDLLPALSGLNP